MRRRAALASILIACAPGPACAHTIVAGLEGFQGGVLHPLLVPVHAASLLAFGLLIGQQRRPHRLALLAGFAGVLVLATVLIVRAVSADWAGTALLASGGAAGLLVAGGRPLPLTVAGIPVLAGGIALQLDSVPAVPSVRETLLSLLGTALAAVLALVLVAGGTLEPKRPWLRAGVRIAGSWIASAVALVLALRLAR